MLCHNPFSQESLWTFPAFQRTIAQSRTQDGQKFKKCVKISTQPRSGSTVCMHRSGMQERAITFTHQISFFFFLHKNHDIIDTLTHSDLLQVGCEIRC